MGMGFGDISRRHRVGGMDTSDDDVPHPPPPADDQPLPPPPADDEMSCFSCSIVITAVVAVVSAHLLIFSDKFFQQASNGALVAVDHHLADPSAAEPAPSFAPAIVAALLAVAFGVNSTRAKEGRACSICIPGFAFLLAALLFVLAAF